jgi:hypothetical protein
VARLLLATTSLLAASLSPLGVAQRVEAQVPPPDHWELLQNDPEPFCISLDVTTRFGVLLPEAGHLQLLLWSPDSTRVIATLMDTVVPGAGTFERFWDGKDDEGFTLPEGEYRYTLVVRDPSQTETLFEASKLATVFCPAPVVPHGWGAMKSLFR